MQCVPSSLFHQAAETPVPPERLVTARLCRVQLTKTDVHAMEQRVRFRMETLAGGDLGRRLFVQQRNTRGEAGER
jgi:hypothetical protein